MDNNAKDPGETKNLARDSGQNKRLITFRQKCDQLLDRYRDMQWDSISNLYSKSVVERQSRKMFLGWSLSPVMTGQKAYQILIAPGLTDLSTNSPGAWNSGRIESSQANALVDLGDIKAKSDKYYWKARVWDEDNRLTEYAAAAEMTDLP